jgi:hypothetical protein
MTSMTDLALPVLGPLAWIDGVLLGWIVLTAASVAYVGWDAFVRGNPDVAVMKWGWLLVTLYMGPVALLLYVPAAKEPRPGTHAALIKPLWKQVVGSTIPCVAGDATGIILAATVTAILGFPMWVDLGVEYAAGFAFGLFIFQSLFMRDMMGGSYRAALRGSFIPEWFSMNLMMAGMILVMVPLMMGRDMRAMEPSQLLYWGTMSLGVLAGFFAAYPVNVWLVAKGLKHGMMRTQAEPEHADGGGEPAADRATRAAHGQGAMSHAGEH